MTDYRNLNKLQPNRTDVEFNNPAKPLPGAETGSTRERAFTEVASRLRRESLSQERDAAHRCSGIDGRTHQLRKRPLMCRANTNERLIVNHPERIAASNQKPPPRKHNNVHSRTAAVKRAAAPAQLSWNAIFGNAHSTRAVDH